MFKLDPQLKKDCIVIASLPLCEFLLMNDRQYPWFILVPRRAGLRELVELTGEESSQLWRESTAVAQLLLKEFGAEKLNIATLGNIVAQLHIHHIARFAADPAWPDPVWGKLPRLPYADNGVDQIIQRVKSRLSVPDERAINWQV